MSVRTPSGADRARAERELLGVDHATAGALLARASGVDQEVIRAIDWHHGGDHGLACPDRVTACVQLADVVAHAMAGAPLDSEGSRVLLQERVALMCFVMLIIGVLIHGAIRLVAVLIPENDGPAGAWARTYHLLVLVWNVAAWLRARSGRRSEQELISANARIGVAKSQYLPTISLTASSGFASNELSKLTQLTSNFGSFGLTILGPLFTSGRIAGEVRSAEAQQKQAEL